MPGYNFTYIGFEMKEIVRNVKMEMKKKVLANDNEGQKSMNPNCSDTILSLNVSFLIERTL